MAQLLPSDLPPHSVAPGLQRELDTLEQLKKDLAASYRVFHGVHWARGYKQSCAFGEADFIILNGRGDCLVIEQKSGALDEVEGGLRKRYGQQSKSVSSQIHRTLDNLRDQYRAQTDRALSLDFLLYCPDHRVQNVEAAGIDASRIVDASSSVSLAERIAQLMPEVAKSEDGDRVARFFEQSLHLVPDIHARVDVNERQYQRTVGGLADTVAAISGRPLRLSIRGTAGCGKSLIALRAFRQFEAQGKRPLLLCFNRDLKEKMASATRDSEGVVETFYGVVDQILKASGRPLIHDGSVDWNDAVNQVLDGDIPEEWQFDAIIVDEAQDFHPGWRDMLELFGGAEGDCIWLEDPHQAIQYGVEPRTSEWPKAGWTGLRVTANYRTPKTIASFIQKLLPDFEFEAVNPMPGLDVGISEVTGAKDIPKAVGRITTELMRKGFNRDQIVALSLRGQSSASLAGRSRVGNITLARFTGEYDLFGNQKWSEGQLRFDTIRRFKGQQAPAVILTDVEMPDDPERRPLWERLMFTALTRATERVELVVQKSCDTSDMLNAACE